MAKSPIRKRDVQFSMLGRDWYAEVHYRVYGRYRDATLTDPAEYPEADIERVLLTGVAPEGLEQGDITFSVPVEVDFSELPARTVESIQTDVDENFAEYEQACRDEAREEAYS